MYLSPPKISSWLFEIPSSIVFQSPKYSRSTHWCCHYRLVCISWNLCKRNHTECPRVGLFFFYWIIRWECIHVDACIASLFLLIVDRYPIMCPYHNNAKTVLSIRFPSPKASGTMRADFNKNDSHRFIYLNVLSLGSGTIWEGLEVWHEALLGEVYHLGWVQKFRASGPGLLCLPTDQRAAPRCSSTCLHAALLPTMVIMN